MSKKILQIIKEEIQQFNRAEYLKWKRQNVTLRGMKEVGKDNGVYGSFGKGLYTAFLSNKSLAKDYGKVYFVVGAIPKHPKVVQYRNDAEILIQELIAKYGKENGIDDYYDARKLFEKNTTIEKEMLKMGYDGLVIKGREMVNYNPENIKYFENEYQLENYYEHLKSNNSNINEILLNLNEVREQFKTLYHGTSQEGARDIMTNGIDMEKSEGGYFGKGFYTTPKPELAKSNYADFSGDEEGGVVLEVEIAPNANILDLRDAEDFETWKPLSRLIHRPDCWKIFTQKGIDGLWDDSFDGVVIYNPNVIHVKGVLN